MQTVRPRSPSVHPLDPQPRQRTHRRPAVSAHVPSWRHAGTSSSSHKHLIPESQTPHSRVANTSV
ncbi:hypothetical protein C8R44DRAFT_786408 [Mycena epipterygia]|nr:hypothetical protein C8R44DRAFT_786408 [Mycena epipterygia]